MCVGVPLADINIKQILKETQIISLPLSCLNRCPMTILFFFSFPSLSPLMQALIFPKLLLSPSD